MPTGKNNKTIPVLNNQQATQIYGGWKVQFHTFLFRDEWSFSTSDCPAMRKDVVKCLVRSLDLF
jgi:hypothetical protein